MANSIALAKNYLAILDEVYKNGALSTILDMANDRVRFTGANKVELYKTEMSGLADYSRNGGFKTGSVTGTWEELTLNKDRATSFSVDNMDNEETMGMAFGTLAGEFMRTEVNPEIDAYRFATYASWSGVQTATSATITIGTTDCVGLIDTAEMELDNEEVPAEGRILFVSPKMYAGLKAKITRYLRNEGNVNHNIEMYDNMPIIKVPQSRFYTGITLNDGSANFGYTNTGAKINFMIVHPTAVAQVVKHAMPRIFSPEVNQTADAWKFDYRVYHDAFVLDNKKKGIYVHYAAN